ncbi:LLM class flavin-dependent oxidoreductase [Mesorhizobium intechi]|uniref:LLM class flavin-dependent oxidoreductase n=1 Tax=Mesorhizobium intechi TaxID=537601 RepID=A0A8T9AW14_9HYPH|nr:LLM class flavin-dependent oxidoreductase [Mesorhizobium intechi]TSE12151.1 LLM class flavin-dependent oxidoreductase [Mesorhizobium intechi]
MVSALTIIGGCPTFDDNMPSEKYMEEIKTSAVRSERYGFSAMLVYSDHQQFDPWLAANCLMNSTKKLSPLVAVQPLYTHPFTVAKLVASLSLVHDRPVHLNFISGGFPHDLEAFCDATTHDQRYERVAEYGEIVRNLLSTGRPISYSGAHYQVSGLHLRMAARIKPDCAPMFTISGSSSAGKTVARRLGARAIEYLRPVRDYDGKPRPEGIEYGTRLGIVSRARAQDAWAVACSRYPDDELGREMREYYTRVSDSVWVKELGAEVTVPAGHPYWLGPYKNGHASCPFLVGSREDIARELIGYFKMGLRTFLLDDPPEDEDAFEIQSVFAMAEEAFASGISDNLPEKEMRLGSGRDVGSQRI